MSFLAWPVHLEVSKLDGLDELKLVDQWLFNSALSEYTREQRGANVQKRWLIHLITLDNQAKVSRRLSSLAELEVKIRVLTFDVKLKSSYVAKQNQMIWPNNIEVYTAQWDGYSFAFAMFLFYDE